MSTKLHVDVVNGILQVEGEEAFVREIYADFKERIDGAFGAATSSTRKPNNQEEKPLPAKPKRKPNSSRRSDGVANKAAKYVPRLDSSLSIDGLKEFYDQFEGPNQSENILIFTKYITGVTNSDVATANQIYTCYSALKVVFPKDILQALRNAKAKERGYIDYEGTDIVRVTPIGENHFNHGLNRKAAE